MASLLLRQFSQSSLFAVQPGGQVLWAVGRREFFWASSVIFTAVGYTLPKVVLGVLSAPKYSMAFLRR